jgi:hypothetical protein
LTETGLLMEGGVPGVATRRLHSGGVEDPGSCRDGTDIPLTLGYWLSTVNSFLMPGLAPGRKVLLLHGSRATGHVLFFMFFMCTVW